MKESLYYSSKLYSLFNKIFIETGDARSRFIECEHQFESAYMASLSDGVPNEIKHYWREMWNDLNTKEELKMNQGKFIRSSFYQTIKSKRNKSLEKYLLFILEEEARLIDTKYSN